MGSSSLGWNQQAEGSDVDDGAGSCPMRAACLTQQFHASCRSDELSLNEHAASVSTAGRSPILSFPFVLRQLTSSGVDVLATGSRSCGDGAR